MGLLSKRTLFVCKLMKNEAIYKNLAKLAEKILRH